MNLVSGFIRKPQRVVIYGPEGIGKSLLASKFPSPVFIDTEHGTEHLDCQRFIIKEWADLLEAVSHLGSEKHEYKTVVIDTADWAEKFCNESICKKAKKSGIEEFGYGKGYTYLAEEFTMFLSKLNQLRDQGMNIVFNAHSTIKKMELPDEAGAFDHYELKCAKTITPLLKEWSDVILFLNYKVIVEQNEDGKVKARGGRDRMLLTTHTAAYDAKNRWGLPGEIKLGDDPLAKIPEVIMLHLAGFDARKETPTAKKGTPKQEAPVKEQPKTEAPVKEQPKTEAPPVVEPTRKEESEGEFEAFCKKEGISVKKVKKMVVDAGHMLPDVDISDELKRKLLSPKNQEILKKKCKE